MGKKARRRSAAPVPHADVAERHTFSGGQLGHDPGWGYGAIEEQNALAVDAVYACVVLIADAVAASEWTERKGVDVLEPSRLVRRPMASITRREWSWLVASTLALYNVCPLRLVGGLDSEGVPYSLVPIAPPRMAPRDRATVFLDGEAVSLEHFRFVRRTSFPTVSARMASILELARTGIAAAGAALLYSADYWAQGGAPITVLTTDQDLTAVQGEAIAERWRERRAKGPSYPAVLGKGAKAEPFGANIAADGSDAAHGRLLASIARYFGVPPHRVNVPSYASSLTYQNTDAASLDLVRYTISAYTDPIGDAISELLPGDYIVGRRVTLDPSRLSRPDVETRFRTYAAGITAGIISAGEARAAEGYALLGDTAPGRPEPEPSPDVAREALPELEGMPA